jgi:hypothetical protein
MEVKCKGCGKQIERDEAYKVIEKGKNSYYCNESEYEVVVAENGYKALTMDLMLEISGLRKLSTQSTILINSLNKKIVNKYGSNEVLYNTIKSNMKLIMDLIDENCIINGGDRVKYALAVLDRHIDDGVKMMRNNKKNKSVEYNDNAEYSMPYIKRKGKSDISAILKKMGEIE